MSELLTLALFGLALALVWHSVSTSMATALCVVAIIEMANSRYIIVDWFGFAVFHGQALMVFSCVALLVVHIRLGELAAHRVWRTAAVTLIMAFLLVTKWSEGVNGEHRIWLSALIQFIVIGGFGQVLWRYCHVDGFRRYGLTLLAFPVGSVAHSFLAFPDPSLWAASATAAFFYGLVFLTGVFVAERFWNKGTQHQRLKRALTELLNGPDHRSLPGNRRQP